MVYSKAYDNASIEGSIVGTAVPTGESFPIITVAAVLNGNRFVDVAFNGNTVRFSTDDARDLIVGLIRSVQEAETMPEMRRGGPIFVDEEGKLYE